MPEGSQRRPTMSDPDTGLLKRMNYTQFLAKYGSGREEVHIPEEEPVLPKVEQVKGGMKRRGRKRKTGGVRHQRNSGSFKIR